MDNKLLNDVMADRDRIRRERDVRQQLPHPTERKPPMKTATKFVAVALSLLALVACGPESGTVTDKTYIPPITKQICDEDGCIPIVDPECWMITFKDSAGDTGNACVSESEFESYEIGDHYPKK